MQFPALLTLVIASVITSTAPAQTYSMKTFAGGALPENVAAASACVGGIYGIAADRAGNVFLSLGDYDLVLRVDAATGTLIRVAGNGSRGFSGDTGAATSAPAVYPDCGTCGRNFMALTWPANPPAGVTAGILRFTISLTK